ncbi:transposase [Mucilaginibacter ginkgonis]|uniref:Transposase IS200-like domain-containing protein n=1 Tax=Mucilaginibacter ginkgonis TaxID=2682091 RepID=A0A7T7JGW6_9SPHI|nr:transposase [Mucilaginibacter ginkgonis]QQL49661.1 hypothetical protein GO620_016050 [Mucilaginibacter ginkgonis]
MGEKFRDKYRTTSFRRPNWDYGSNGLYFVTICTKDKTHYFGDIVETQHIVSLQKTEIANIAFKNWLEIPKHFSFVELDDFVIMPNHLHGILFIINLIKQIGMSTSLVAKVIILHRS